MHFQHTTARRLFICNVFCFSAHVFRLVMCCVWVRDCWVAKEFANWVNRLMCSSSCIVSARNKSLIHNHRCIFTAAQERSQQLVSCTCNYANLSTPLVYAALLLAACCSAPCVAGLHYPARGCSAPVSSVMLLLQLHTLIHGGGDDRVFDVCTAQPAAKFSLSRAQWRNLNWLSRGTNNM
jgi:hypothetical protein